MLSSLPNRPLYDHELDALNESDALRLVFPAMPDSLQYDAEDKRQYHDLFLFVDDSVVVVSYDENQEGWTVVAREDGDDPYDPAFDKLLEHRGYVDDQEAEIREVGRQFYKVAKEAEEVALDEFEEEFQ
jgi:hypothetical protein